MRRSDREIVDRAAMREVLTNCEVLSLALMDGAYPYVIQLNFGWEECGEQLCLYFHGAKAGKKLDLIRENDHAAFAMSCTHAYVPGANDCSATFRYQSVCGRGRIEILEGAREKAHALARIMAQYAPERAHAFTDAQVHNIAILRLTVESITGKQNIK
ncbi:MAG: pyridoxamine 5'-phosphate oxidase family protein [Christensenellales bacterium]|jgi:nitroimidazol reductase NimA-like FMN-containing flavoprotein (pyridoxamine 5'-phosphate oxidase superfamily)